MNYSKATVAAAVLLALGLPHAGAQVSGDTVKIGFITDMSSLYADFDGKHGAEAVRMAIEDFGGKVLGKPIEFVSADHQNKADIAAAKAREWYDQGTDLVLGGTNSGTALAVSGVAAGKKRVYINVGAGSSRLTNEECTPYTVHYAYDTIALSKGTASAILAQGGKSWFFLTADYAFGHSLEVDTGAVVKARGGSVAGSVRHPLNASDFSSFLLQAQASKAQVLGFANAGGDFISAVKSAREFGIAKNMKMVGLLVFLTDVHSLGLPTAQGLLLTDSWYWDLNDKTRQFAQRFQARTKKMPSSPQAGDYSAVTAYLNAVKAAGTDDPDKVMAELKKTPIDDFYAKGRIRADGRFVHDMYLLQAKAPAESKGPWDLLKVVATMPGEQVFATPAESKCALLKR
ncbi:ABC transporter substrate-binding protein [Eleftheria terrae]|uniref:ABC transporter substrate-binding protein n=1 Tax=Eleftheria terrae TaxID=1597781 RepID=UPI00263B1B0E|nr:ABC transporter substrate-binding protein [Eleftheria terrae]WKB51066.1 ABC transporter substrate-binding protein [Eleftheria terrae]